MWRRNEFGGSAGIVSSPFIYIRIVRQRRVRRGYPEYFGDQVRDDGFNATRWIRNLTGEMLGELGGRDAVNHRHTTDCLRAVIQQLLDAVEDGQRIQNGSYGTATL